MSWTNQRLTAFKTWNPKKKPDHKTCEHGLYLYSNPNKSDNLTLRRHEFTISYDIDVNKTKNSDCIP